MKYPTIFHLISTEFEKAEIPYVLIGGFAVNYYGVTRQTADVDLLITKKDIAKVLELLKRAGYKQGLMEEVFARLENNKTYLMDIDLMFVDKETLARIIKDGKKIKIAGKRFVVPSLNHLIALKLHSIKFNPKIREFKDLLDIINLLRMNKVNVKTDREARYLMKKLNLPVMQNSFLDTKCLSMDEYLKFVLLHLKYTFDRKAYKVWKKRQTVNVPFSLK